MPRTTHLPPLPTTPIGTLDELISCARISNTPRFGIPIDFLIGTKRHIAQQDRFGQSRRILEVAVGRTSCLARQNPLLVVTRRARQGRGWGLKIGKPIFREELNPNSMREVDHAPLPNTKDPIRRHRTVLDKLRRGLASAIVPRQLDWGHAMPSGELVAHDAPLGPSTLTGSPNSNAQ